MKSESLLKVRADYLEGWMLWLRRETRPNPYCQHRHTLAGYDRAAKTYNRGESADVAQGLKRAAEYIPT